MGDGAETDVCAGATVWRGVTPASCLPPPPLGGGGRPWPRACWPHPVPSRTRSGPSAAPESTGGATPWEARPPRPPPTPGVGESGRTPRTHIHRGVEQRQLVGLIT